ncbi:16745_t:CDS:2 [Funneliformis caledonium]|uniref:16745_t:CDS:1 n=1 Tax=Funneliformis caledonium TaxID=1117310 RepID=A0A9N9G8D3_9GLOM|nr:16745_t:CDS:2 [Funneliformis caledonium]
MTNDWANHLNGQMTRSFPNTALSYIVKPFINLGDGRFQVPRHTNSPLSPPLSLFEFRSYLYFRLLMQNHRIVIFELPDLTLVAAVISSIINCPVKTYDECIAEGRSSKNDPASTYSGKNEIDEDNSKIDEDNEIDERSRTYHHHQTVPPYNQVDNVQHPQPIQSSQPIQIFFKFSEESRSIFISPDITVLELKKKIQAMLNIDMISLSFSSKPLEDHRTLKSYNINQNDRGVINYFVLNNQFVDPYNNWNLTDIKMGKNYIRGGRVYAPPYGWNRIGLNTRRYGKGKWMSNDASKSWSVSYNGVNRVRAEITIIRGQEQTKQQFTKYGKGIYSTPDIKYAEQYAIIRRNQILHNNDRYLYVFQNRVNPRDLEDRGIEWITKKSNNIRPYVLCIKRYY